MIGKQGVPALRNQGFPTGCKVLGTKYRKARIRSGRGEEKSEETNRSDLKAPLDMERLGSLDP